jgi:4-alpha-glucanotransferase
VLPQAKLRIARAVFDRGGAADLDSEAFRAFEAANREWLQPYAVFRVLRRLFGTGEHWRWGALSQPTQEVGEGPLSLASHVRFVAAPTWPLLVLM